MNWAGFAEIRVGETGTAIEIDEQFERFGGGIEVARNDFPRCGETEGLAEEMYEGQGPEIRGGRRTAEASSRCAPKWALPTKSTIVPEILVAGPEMELRLLRVGDHCRGAGLNCLNGKSSQRKETSP